MRVRVWTKVEDVGGRDYAGRIAALAVSKGFRPYITLMLQPYWNQANPAWTTLSPDARAQAIHNYCRDTVAYFRGLGLTSGIYELGNELDWGLEGAGVFESDKQKREDPVYMSAAIWPRVARLLKACEDGVRESDGGSGFVLHMYHEWFDVRFAQIFYETMRTNGAAFDFIGLSYYPSSTGTTIDNFLSNVLALNQHFGKPVLVAEYAYPSSPDIPSSPFVTWNRALPGYPLDPDGQKKWLSDFLSRTYQTPAILGTFYESPEWYAVDRFWGTAYWAVFALFSQDGNAKPALDAFAVLPKPGVRITLSGSHFRPAQTLTIGLQAENPPRSEEADLYVGAILPDGQSVVCVSNSGTVAGPLSLGTPSLCPRIQAAPLDFSLNTPSFFQFTFPPAGVPPGTYQVFAALVRQGALEDNRIDPGDILALDLKVLVFSP